MDRPYLKIEPPVVLSEGEKSVLQATIDDNGTKKICKYIVDKKFEKYLCSERSDAFVVCLMYYAMLKDRDIIWEIPCNERLIYQLETFLIPTYEREIPSMHGIKLIGPTTTELLPSKNGVATGFSNGVDSSYTVRKYLNSKYPERKLTHLLFTNCFVTTEVQEYQDDFLKSYLNVMPKCAEELGLEFIYVEFPLDKEFSVGYIEDEKCGGISDLGLSTMKYCSIPLALQKLLHIYYFSSGFTVSDFEVCSNDVAHNDIFVLPLLSTEVMTFYSSGVETPRVEKVGTIVDWPYAQKHLQVCAEYNDTNCGHCWKCVRTMTDLYAYGKLECFDKVFPVDDYKAHLAQRMGFVIAKANGGLGLYRESMEKVSEMGRKVPFAAYLYSVLYWIKDFLFKHLGKYNWARKLYRRMGLGRIFNSHRRFDLSKRMDTIVAAAEKH